MGYPLGKPGWVILWEGQDGLFFGGGQVGADDHILSNFFFAGCVFVMFSQDVCLSWFIACILLRGGDIVATDSWRTG